MENGQNGLVQEATLSPSLCHSRFHAVTPLTGTPCSSMLASPNSKLSISLCKSLVIESYSTETGHSALQICALLYSSPTPILFYSPPPHSCQLPHILPFPAYFRQFNSGQPLHANSGTPLLCGRKMEHPGGGGG